MSWKAMRHLGLACAAIALNLEGCSCDGKVNPGSSATSIEFMFPTAGSTVDSSEDRSSAEPGIQVDVRAGVKGLDGQVLILTNSLDVDSRGVPVPITATASGGQIVFAGYTLPLGDVSLTIAREGVDPGADCDGSNCDRVAISVAETSCSFVTPRHGDTLTDDAYSPAGEPFSIFETDVSVECRGLAEGDYVALRVNGGLPIVAQSDSAGHVIFNQRCMSQPAVLGCAVTDLRDGVALAEGDNLLAVLPGTDAMGEGGQGGVTRATVTVSTGRCSATLYPVDGAVILADDDNDFDSSNGMQTTIDVVTDCDANSTVTLYLAPSDTSPGLMIYQGTPTALPDLAGTRFRITPLPSPFQPSTDDCRVSPMPGGCRALPESAQTHDVVLVGVVEEISGSASGTTLPATYWVDTFRPEIVTMTPADGACMGPGDDIDNDLTNGMQQALFGTLNEGGEGTEVWLRDPSITDGDCTDDTHCADGQLCRQEICRDVVSATDGNFLFEELTFATGVIARELVAIDAAGNIGKPRLVTFSVADTVPTIVITDPLPDAVLSASQDGNTSSPGLQYNVTVNVDHVPAGTVGTLTISGQSPIPFVPPANTEATISIPATLENGTRTLRASVSNSCGEVILSSDVAVTVNAVPPQLLVTAYEGGQFAARKRVANDSTVGIGSIDLDVFLGQALTTRTVSVRLFNGVATDGSCTGTETQAASTQSVAADDVGTLFVEVPLTGGLNCVSVSSADGTDTLTTALLITRRVSAIMPAISLPTTATVSWNAGDDSSSTIPGFNQTIEVTLASADDGAGIITLELGGSVIATSAIAGGATTVTFADLALPAGSYDIMPRYTDRFGLTQIGTALGVTVDNGGGPAVLLASPIDGVFAGSLTIDATIEQIAGSPDPVDCVLTATDAQSAETTQNVTWTSSPQAVQIIVAAEGVYTLQASCTNTANTGYTQAVTVTIDTTAPAAPTFVDEAVDAEGRIIFVADAWVNGLVPDTSTADGLQHGVVIAVDGELDSSIQLEATPEGAAMAAYEQTVVGAGAQELTFNGVEMGDADGTLTLTVRAVDRAGNASSDTVVVLIVDRTAPVIAQTLPDVARTLYSRGDDQDLNLTYVDLRFSYRVVGGTDGADCSVDGDNCLSLTAVPAPNGTMSAADFPVQIPLISGGAAFASLPFADGSYTVRVETHDAAGNRGAVAHSFDIIGVLPDLIFAVPNSGGGLNAASNTGAPGAYQRTFSFNASAFAAGTQVVLCSTVPGPGAGSTPCRWGLNAGVPEVGATDQQGFIVATGPLTGTTALGAASLSDVRLAEGAQVMHAEIRSAAGTPDEVTKFLAFTVDSVAPSVTTIMATADTAPLGMLNATEGTASAGTLQTEIVVQVSGAEEGRVVTLRTSKGAAVVGSAPLVGSSEPRTATITATLPEGTQTLSVSVTDVIGNVNNPVTSMTLPVTVDVTAGTALVRAAIKTPYTAADGTINDGGTSGNRTDDSLELQIQVEVDDNSGVEGATLSLVRVTDAVGTAVVAGTESTRTLGNGETVANFTFPLVAGSNFLRATFTDLTGFETVSAVETFGADFYGPLLTLMVYDGASTPALRADCAATAASPCTADVLDPAAPINGGVAYFDRDASDPYDPSTAIPGASVYNDGTDVFYTLTECANAPGMEVCDGSSGATIQLESKVVGSVGSFAPVAESWVTADVSLPASLWADGGIYGFGPGIQRELRLVAVDAHGNTSTSASIFLTLSNGGIGVTVWRLDVSHVNTTDTLATGREWGVEHNLGQLDSDQSSGFAAHFQVDVAPINNENATHVDLEVNGVGLGAQVLVTASAQFDDVAFLESPTLRAADKTPNTIRVLIYCDSDTNFGNECGVTTYSDVLVDIERPRFQFDRCDLCRLGVPMLDATACLSMPASCQSANTNASGINGNIDLAAVATWNKSLDELPATASHFDVVNGFRVLLSGVENDQAVTINTDQGAGLSGAGATALGCDTDVGCGADFNGLAVPTLSADGVHTLTITVADKVGNGGKPDVLRSAGEVIKAETDVEAPVGPVAVICNGTPTDDATCQTACVCGRSTDSTSCPQLPGCTWDGSACTGSYLGCDSRRGSVTAVWTASADDGASGSPVASYDILTAALYVSYSGTEVLSCSELQRDAAGDVTVDPGVQVTAEAIVAPGGTQMSVIQGLLPHRSYCFAVESVDDVGNRAVVAGTQVERDLAFQHSPTAITFDPDWQTRVDNDATAAAFEAAGTSIGSSLVNIGNIDDHAGDDFLATTGFAQKGVRIFLSGAVSGGVMGTPVSIMPPANSVGYTGMFSAAGDFNGDGISDVAICDPVFNGSGGRANGGALFVYYGTGLAGGITMDTSGGADVPNYKPDVAVLGAAGDQICHGVAAGQVDGAGGGTSAINGADIVLRTATGDIIGFSWSLGRFTDPIVFLDPLSDGLADALNTSRPDFMTDSSVAGIWQVALADVTGDGRKEVALSNQLKDHGSCFGCGEVYVFDGAAVYGKMLALVGSAVASAPINLLRFNSSADHFGQGMWSIPAPRRDNAASDVGDWLMVHAFGGTGSVVVFKGSSVTGAIELPSDPCVVDGVICADGMSTAKYTVLSRGDWGGGSIGFAFADASSIGDFDRMGGTDVIVSGGTVGTRKYAIIYTYREISDMLISASILGGVGDFGRSVVGVNGFLDNVDESLQLVISDPSSDQLFLIY